MFRNFFPTKYGVRAGLIHEVGAGIKRGGLILWSRLVSREVV